MITYKKNNFYSLDNWKFSFRAFTLIELLAVIAIIGLLATMAAVSLQEVRAKARDAKRIADFKAVSTAMELYYDKFGKYPPSPNYCCSPGSGGTHNQNFENMVQHLVDEGFLGAVPKDPSDPPQAYMHYKYGAGGAPGALLVTNLESIAPTTVGPYGSCRPFTNNWCSHTLPSKLYCLCHPY